MSLQTYLARLLDRSTAIPPLAEWLERLDDLPEHRGICGAAAVQDARDELP